MSKKTRVTLVTTANLDTKVDRSPNSGFYLIHLVEGGSTVSLEIERSLAQRLAAQITTQVQTDLQQTEEQLRRWVGSG
jgi:hypothetical protein